jgi:hypothetical protein
MNCVQTTSIHRARIDAGRGALPGKSCVAPNAVPGDERALQPEDRAFELMRAAYGPSGGIARSGDLARLLEDLRCDDYTRLVRLVVSRRVFGFEWQHDFWVPMFQFELRDLSLKSRQLAVLDELVGIFDGWSLAAWFAAPNAWLADQRPVDLLDTDLPAVLAAARADRFVATG